MIPLHLTIQGLYSYQQKQSIDFVKLTEAHIFGIFGSVGSGKSAILEAITFALYGRTDRLNLSGDNRNYNMMNLKSNELLIEFVFKAENEEHEYMIRVKGRRNSKQFEDVKAIERTAYQKKDTSWEPVEFILIEKAIGLSYENFKRTIIIPQGKFQEFLQLGNKERTQMMKELFNLEKYEMFYKVVSLESKNKEELRILEGKLQQLGELNPENVSAIGKELTVLKEEIENSGKELVRLQLHDNQLKKIKELVLKLKETEKSLNHLAEEDLKYRQIEKKIKEYEYCIINFKGLIESLIEINGRIEKLTKTISEYEQKFEKNQKELTEQESKLLPLKKEYDNRDVLKQQAEDLLQIMDIKKLEGEVDELLVRISNGNEHLDKTKSAIEMLQNIFDDSTKEIKTLRAQIPDRTILSKVKSWFTENNLLINSQKELMNEISQFTAQIEAFQSQKEALVNKELSGVSTNIGFADLETLLTEKIQGLKQFIGDINAELEHLNVQLKLDEYVSGLEEGKPCPLCGALSHPRLLETKDMSELIKEAKSKRTMHELAITGLEELGKKSKVMESNVNLKNELLEKSRHKLIEQEAKINVHKEAFIWPDFSEEKKVDDAFVKAEQMDKQLQNKEEEQEKLSLKLKKEQGNLVEFSQAIERFKHQHTIKETEKKTKKTQLKIFRAEDYKNTGNPEIEDTRNLILARLAELEKEYQACQILVDAGRKEINNITGSLEANRKVLSEAMEQRVDTQRKFDERLKQSEYNSAAEIEKVVSFNADIESEKKKIEEYKQKVELLSQQSISLKEELGDKKYEEQAHKDILSSINQVTKELSIKNQYFGKQENVLKKLKEDVAAQGSLLEKQKSLQVREEDIKTLKRLFKASGFVNYVSSVKLQEICHAANKRFYELTRQKLSLEVTDDNTFQVRDFLNGGKVRNVKTLSGGQTFQAALSLALSLADNIQKFTESNQNFFFLDEGFGSLDKESLNIVFDTLKSLRKENRIVGVISHVEEMQQEIDVHLRIANDEETGSVINTSWGL